MATKLLDLVRETAQLKHLSHRTEESYTQWIKRFILFHKKCHPVDIREEEVRRFLTYLVQQKYVSSSIQNQATKQYKGILGIRCASKTNLYLQAHHALAVSSDFIIACPY